MKLLQCRGSHRRRAPQIGHKRVLRSDRRFVRNPARNLVRNQVHSHAFSLGLSQGFNPGLNHGLNRVFNRNPLDVLHSRKHAHNSARKHVRRRALNRSRAVSLHLHDSCSNQALVRRVKVVHVCKVEVRATTASDVATESDYS